MDEFEGFGGSYNVDPKTGARTLIERTQEAASQDNVEPAQVPAEQPVTAEGA
jgi:hypothetical protein